MIINVDIVESGNAGFLSLSPNSIKVGAVGDNEATTVRAKLPVLIGELDADAFVCTIHIEKPDKTKFEFIAPIVYIDGIAYTEFLVNRSMTDVGTYGYSIVFTKTVNDDVIVQGTTRGSLLVLSRVDADGETIEEIEPNILEQILGEIANKQDVLVAGANIEIDPETNTISASGGGGGGTGDHAQLINRSSNDQHPMSAITGLVLALAGKATSSHTQASSTIIFGDGDTLQEKLDNGDLGSDARGIVSILKTNTTGLVDTYTITYSDETTDTFTVTNGAQGTQGNQGVQGVGISSIAKTNTTGLTDTYTITYSNSTTTTFSVVNGNGISSIAKTGTAGLVDTYTITYSNGTTSTFTISNGAQGIQGPPGNDGTSVTILGSYATIEELEIAHPTGNVGDAYIIVGDLYVWTSAWTNVGAIQGPVGPEGPQGDAGDEVVLQKTATHIQWKYLADVDWTDLVALADITGPEGTAGTDGQEIELQKTATHIQWRYIGDSWTDLVALDDIKGPEGPKGATGTNATINGSETLAITGTGNVEYNQVGDVGTIDTVQYPSFEGIHFNTVTPITVSTPGDIGFNVAEGTFDMRLLSGVTLQAGQEMHVFGKAVGNIVNGDVVQFAGAQGDHILIKKAVVAEINANPHYLLGVCTSNIANNAFGYITSCGNINNTYTDGWTAGQALYYDNTNATLTASAPSSGIKYHVGYVVREATGGTENGKIFINVHRIYSASDVGADPSGTATTAVGNHDISGTSHTDIRTLIAGKENFHGVESFGNFTFDNNTHVLTISAITYWYKGTKVELTNPVTCDIDTYFTLEANTLYYIAFDDASGTLKAFNSMNLKTRVPTCMVYWNGTVGIITRETHAHTRDIDWHIWSHFTVGTRYRSGLSMTINTGDETFSVASGEIMDEDILHTIPTQTQARLWYQTGDSKYTFLTTPSSTAGYLGANGRPNYVNASTYALAEVASSPVRYLNVFVYATNDIAVPIYFFTETTSATTGYSSIANARAVPFPNLSSMGLAPEMKPIYRLIWRADGNLQTIDLALDDYRSVTSLPMASGTVSTTASAVAFAPVSGIDATTVQLAIEELNTEKQPVGSYQPAGDYATLDGTGKVPQSQLPSYVDDVEEYANFAALPATGEGKIYITLDDNKTYRWSGTVYVEISASLALGNTSATAYRGDYGETAYNHSQSTHAPSNAEQNVNADWNASSGDAQILNKPTIITSHTGLSDIGTNTHANIDTHIADTSDPHGNAITQTKMTVSKVITPIATPTYNATMIINTTTDSHFLITATGNLAITLDANMEIGRVINIHINATSAVGTFSLAGDAGTTVKWLGGTPTTIASGKLMLIGIRKLSATLYEAGWSVEA